MVKKITILFQFVLMLVAVSYTQAQVMTGSDAAVKVDTVVQPSTDNSRVITNKFWDNWYIGAGAGAQIFFNDHDRQMEFGERLSPAFTFYVGKWISPVFGFRLGASGFKANGATQNGAHSTGDPYDGKPWEGYWLEKQEIPFYHLHGDVLLNLMNAFGGYKEDRVYSLSPYAGLGWTVAHKSPKARELSASLGLYNSFRVSPAVDLTLDIRGNMVSDRFDGEVGGRKEEGVLAATVGVVYKFKRRGWELPSNTVITQRYDDAVLAKMQEELDGLTDENQQLREQLANAKHETITEIKEVNNVLAAPILLTFPINEATIDNEARVQLGFFAEIIKKGGSEIVYNVTGYADRGTGTPEINERLSMERAQAVYDVLVGEFNVSPSQLKVSYEGGVDNMFYDDPRLSRAVITKVSEDKPTGRTGDRREAKL